MAQYSDDPHKEFLLKDHMDRRSLQTAVDRIRHRGGSTQTGRAMDFLRTDFFTTQAGSRANQRVPQIAVVITDGESSDDVVVPARRLRQHGVIVFGIGVGETINLQELEDIANLPRDRFLLTIDHYDALEREKDRLLKTVCGSVQYEKEGKSRDWWGRLFVYFAIEYKNNYPRKTFLSNTFSFPQRNIPTFGLPCLVSVLMLWNSDG